MGWVCRINAAPRRRPNSGRQARRAAVLHQLTGVSASLHSVLRLKCFSATGLGGAVTAA
jgi:hypothetical protein